jgi:hypothetical protein
MKIARITLGFLCIIAAAIPSHLLYATHEDGNLRNPGLFLAMFIASVTSFAVFSLTKKLPSFTSQLIAGILGSYLAFLGLVFLIAAITGDTAETIMWTPIIVLFGIPFMAPLVGLSWLSSVLIFGIKKK